MQFPLVVYSTNQNGAVASLLTRLSVLERESCFCRQLLELQKQRWGLNQSEGSSRRRRPSCNFGEQESLGSSRNHLVPLLSSSLPSGLGFVALSRVLLMMRHNALLYCQRMTFITVQSNEYSMTGMKNTTADATHISTLFENCQKSRSHYFFSKRDSFIRIFKLWNFGFLYQYII